MKFIRERTATAVIVAIALAGGLGACKGKDQYAANGDTLAAKSDSAAGSAKMDTTTPAAATPAPAPASTWSDAGILGYLWAANNGEVELGKLAETKATNPAVKSFARMMVTDHRAGLTTTKSLVNKTKAIADTASGDARSMIDGGRDALKELTEKPAGADWDKNYMDKMVDGHQKVLDKLQDAAKNTTNADITAALTKVTGKVQEHLTKAQSIKEKNLKAN